MKYDALFNKIREKGFSLSTFRKACGFSKTTFSRRMSGKVEFTLCEIQKIIKLLGLSEEETMGIFFPDYMGNVA